MADLSNSSGILTQEAAQMLVEDVACQEVLQETRELVHVDLTLLKTREDFLCFYGNLINLFTIHTILYHVLNNKSKVFILDVLYTTPFGRSYYVRVV